MFWTAIYNGVDGDSASSTEAYALLSSLSEVPINQSLAVTGSVNQKGEIQPIGGVKWENWRVLSNLQDAWFDWWTWCYYTYSKY